MTRWKPPSGVRVRWSDPAYSAITCWREQVERTGLIRADEAEDVEGLLRILEQIEEEESIECEVRSGHSTWIQIKSGNKMATLKHEAGPNIVWVLTFG